MPRRPPPWSPGGRWASATSAFRRSGAMSTHCGPSPTIAGCSAFTRVGASSITSVRTRLVTPPLTVVTVVDPGIGRSRARPPKTRIEDSSPSRGVRVDHLGVADELERHEPHGAVGVVLADPVTSRSIAASTRWSTSPTSSRCFAIVCGSARSNPSPRARPPTSSRPASARDWSRPVTTTSRPSSAYAFASSRPSPACRRRRRRRRGHAQTAAVRSAHSGRSSPTGEDVVPRRVELRKMLARSTPRSLPLRFRARPATNTESTFDVSAKTTIVAADRPSGPC